MTDSHIDAALAHHDAHGRDAVDALAALVRIPGVSAEGFKAAEVARSAGAVAALLERMAFPTVEILSGQGPHPYVVAERIQDPALPTVLLYAHHDVQPPGDPRAWRTPPFEPAVREGRLFGRGAADDKAGIVVHAWAVAAWVRGAGRLPVNVRLLVEGEEETGSAHLASFVGRHRERLAADALVLADTGNVAVGVPCVTVSVRGLVCVDVEVRAPEGTDGPDVGVALAQMLAALVDGGGRLAIPGLVERVRPLATVQRRALAALSAGFREIGALAGVRPGVRLFSSRHPLELCWWEPAVTVNALEAVPGDGAAAPASAFAQIGVRIVPDLEPADVRDRLVEALRAAAPPGVVLEFRTRDLVPAWQTDLAHPAFDAAFLALERGFGHPALAIGCGASIGFVEALTGALGGVPAILVGVADPTSNPHSENESVSLADLDRAIRSEIHLLGELAAALGRGARAR